MTAQGENVSSLFAMFGLSEKDQSAHRALKSMPGECSTFHGDLIEEVRPSNSVDSMARIAWAAAAGGAGGGAGGDCSWAELTRALNLIWRTEVSAADLLAPEHLDLLAEKLQVLDCS